MHIKPNLTLHRFPQLLIIELFRLTIEMDTLKIRMNVNICIIMPHRLRTYSLLKLYIIWNTLKFTPIVPVEDGQPRCATNNTIMCANTAWPK